MEIAFIALLAFIIDCIIGDPYTKFHPVALMGKLIDFLDKLLRKDDSAEPTKLVCGFILVLIMLGISYAIPYYLILIQCPNLVKYSHSSTHFKLYDFTKIIS